MDTTISAQETSIYKIFSDDYLFTIPSVQRPYSWTTEEAGELLNDLINFIDHFEINEKNFSNVNEPYFLGSIVLVKKDSPKSEVLDGQQRLTTITILLAVLRDFLGGDYAAEIEEMIVQKGKKILNTSDTYRICLRKKDNDFFKSNIQIKGAIKRLSKDTDVKTDSQRHIRDNALYLLGCLKDLDEKTIKVLPSVIAYLCYIVVVSTPNFDSAFRIFTVLNDRGLDLMPSDIFKARVIGEIHEKEQEEYTLKWEDVEYSLGREKFNKLFDHLRMIVQKRKSSENYKDEYDKIFSVISGKQFIDEYLIPYSEIYLKLIQYQTFFSNQPQIIKALSLLNRIDNSDWIPIAMYYMKDSNDRIEEFFYRLEKFAGISMILRKNFNWRMSKYSQILRDFENGVDLFSTESSLEVTVQDEEAVLEKLTGDVYLDLKDTAKKYVLLKLDSLLTIGQPYYDYTVITVEHVLPQKPHETSNWLRHFSDYEQYVHKLGNLVLLTRAKNSLARNYEFPKKKSAYFQSKSGVTSFAITTQVIQENEWTSEVIEKRQKKLIDLLKKAWKIKVKEDTIHAPIVDIFENLEPVKENKTKHQLYNKAIKEKYLSKFENKKTRNTIRYVFYKAFSAEDFLERDLFTFNSTEISKIIKNTNPHNVLVAKSNGRFISSYITWAIEQGYRTNKINPMTGLDDTYYDEFVDKTKKTHFSFEEFVNLLEQLPNAQDKVFLTLLWEGLSLDELREIQDSDINLDNNEIRIRDRTGEILKINQRFVRYIENARNEMKYRTFKESGVYNESELLPSNYLFKKLKSPRSIENEPINVNVFYKRLENLKKEFNLEYLTPNSLKQSGMIKMAVDLYLEEDRLEKEQFAKIGDKYNLSKMTTAGYEYYNTTIMKDNINPEKIKELYNLDIQF